MLLSALLLAPSTSAQAPTPGDIANLVAAKFKNRIVPLRHVLTASTVKYDEAGHLIGKPQGGDWTLHSRFEITAVEFKNGILKLKGNRIAMTFEDWEVDKTPKNLRTSEHLEIQITVDKSAAFSMDRELKKAFLAATEVLPENLEPQWKRFVQCQGKPASGDCDFRRGNAPRIEPGGNILEPQLKNMTNPSYTNVARQARLQGTVSLVVIVDQTGTTKDIEVVRPLGLGLDEAAIQKVKTRTFSPGTRAGKPLAVYVEVFVNFSLRQ
jgi:TonB family protein